MLTHEHVQHLARRNDTLAEKIAKLKHKGAKATGALIRTGEVIAGAALGGLIQGMSKDPNGAHFLKVPVDLGAGIALKLAEVLDLAGTEWSSHLGNLGDGFFGAYFSDLGHSIGVRKAKTGSFFAAKNPGQLGPGVAGDVSPQQMAAMLAQQMAARQGG